MFNINILSKLTILTFDLAYDYYKTKQFSFFKIIAFKHF